MTPLPYLLGEMCPFFLPPAVELTPDIELAFFYPEDGSPPFLDFSRLPVNGLGK